MVEVLNAPLLTRKSRTHQRVCCLFKEGSLLRLKDDWHSLFPNLVLLTCLDGDPYLLVGVICDSQAGINLHIEYSVGAWLAPCGWRCLNQRRSLMDTFGSVVKLVVSDTRSCM